MTSCLAVVQKKIRRQLASTSKLGHLMQNASTATVADLVKHLKESFKPEQELAFFDEGGAWCEVYGVPASFVGSKMLVDASKVDLGGVHEQEGEVFIC